MGRQDMFDAQKFAQSYRSARPALKDLLRQQNIAALDELERTMRQYSHQTFGAGGGFGKWRIAMAPVMLTYGVLLGSPYGMVEGAAALGGPGLYTELAMNPAFARSVSATTRTLATGVPVLGAIRGYQNQPYRYDGKQWVKVNPPRQPEAQ